MLQFRFLALPALATVFILAACGRDEKKDEIEPATHDVGTVNITTADGREVVKADTATGRVAVDMPGFKGEITLPPLAVGAGSMDIDGVELFPGTKVDGVDVRAGRAGQEDIVTVRFTSPANAAAVRAYFLAAFKDKGVTATAGADGTISGTSQDNDAFTLAIADKGTAASAGTLVFRNKAEE